MKLSRRKFVAHTSGLLFSLQPFLKTFAANLSGSKKILVLIHLAGGNDWFNTIIPYQCSDYYQSRPHLAIASDTTLPLNDVLALHPAMPGIKTLYDQGKVSILLNVGHNQPTLSHHKAIEILHTGWLDRYAKLANQDNSLIFPAINVEPSLPTKDQIIVSSLCAANKFAFDIDVHYRLNPRRDALHAPADTNIENTGSSRCSSPLQNAFADGLNRIADMIKKNTNATIYNLSLGGFDTHENQLDQHAFLLDMLSDAIFSFQQNLNRHGLADRVLTVIQSEFGRSLKENDDLGTDHGPTNHALIIGNRVKGGIYPNHYDPMDFITDRRLYLSG